jgi:hypothetical protein
VGPLEVRQGALASSVPAATFHAEAPPGRGSAPSPLRLSTPAGVLGTRTAPAAWRADGWTWVALPPGGRVEADVARRELPWAIRRDGEPQVDLQRLPGDVAHVRVRGPGGEVVLDGAPSPG